MSGNPQPQPDATDPGHFPERETVRRALRGDSGAFHEVVLLYSRRLYAVAYGVVQNPTEAEDVVQETFLKAYALRWMIRDPEKFPAWLCRTARNRAIDLMRKHRPQPLAHDDETLAEIADESVPCPSANLQAIEKYGPMHRLLETLPDNHRIAITLRFMEEMDYREIEETMGINPGTVRGILARAMKTLRKGIGTSLLPEITGVK
jgi:RNA polymerase sigma-70 factor (ECF subfamily)